MATETITLYLPAIHCDGCLHTARRTLEQAGATFESGDANSKRVVVSFDGERLTRQQVEEALEAIGFPPEAES